MYLDYNNPYIPPNKELWKFKKLCKKINGEHRTPYPGEWDILIEFMYPEEDRILERLDRVPQKKEKMVSVFNYTYHDMETGNTEDKYFYVPISEKEDYL